MSMQPWEVEHIEREQARERTARTHYHVRQGAAAAVPGGDEGQVVETPESARTLTDGDVSDLEEVGYVLDESPPSSTLQHLFSACPHCVSARWYLYMPGAYGAAQIVEIERCQEDCL